MDTIKKLRRRMTILVSAVLILVTAGIVFMINYMNWRNIASQAESALETLADNKGSRPGLPGDAAGGSLQGAGTRPDEGASEGSKPGGSQPDAKGPAGVDPGNGPAPGGWRSDLSSSGQPPQIHDALAALSNYYVITLASDGSVAEWISDRAYLYTDEQVGDMAALVLASGSRSGRIGSQFFTISEQKDEDLLIVLDERLEVMAARRILWTSAIIAGIACLLLCICAWLLIRFMVKPVQNAFERQRQFVWDASHELKTPLAVIGANAQVLEGEIGHNESLSYISEEVQRTNRMIQNLLTLARTDQSNYRQQFTQVNLGDIVLSAVLPLESSTFDMGRTIDTQIAEDVQCKGDPDLLRQLTVILLNNAIKYSDEGSVITVRVQKHGKGGLLQVGNLGEHILPADLERLFDRFYRADISHSRSVEGQGLGLSIARNITRLHKGTIKASNSPADGGRYRTVFTVTI